MTSTERLRNHDQMVKFLDTLAVLIGCKGSIGGQLPDGLRPDVLRIDAKHGVLFVGDAKYTETPRCLDTQVRLQGYLRWCLAHVLHDNRVGVFAICFRKWSDAKRWVEVVSLLGREVGLSFSGHGIERFDTNLFVVWFVLGSREIFFRVYGRKNSKI